MEPVIDLEQEVRRAPALATDAFAGEERPSHGPASTRWREIASDELDGFNQRLLKTNASVLQYPYWNEPYRQLGFQPVFLSWDAPDGQPLVYACVLAAGLGPVRIGLVLRGPVSFSPKTEIPEAALEELRRWARAKGYMFLRFTHSNAELLNRIAQLRPSERSDAFPFYEDVAAANHDLLIDLERDEEQILRGFEKEIRRQIRKAAEAGYEIRYDDSDEAMEKAWPLFVACGERKGFQLQKPLQAYKQMVRLARQHRCVRIYEVSLSGKPVQFALILRDRDRAWNVLLARDTAALKSHPSPGPWMHWQVMRDMRSDGVLEYNLGLAVGTVGRFKQQFHPRMQTYPAPVTLLIQPALFHVWTKCLPVTRILMPAVSRIMQLARGGKEEL